MAILAESYFNCSIHLVEDADKEELASFLRVKASLIFSEIYNTNGNIGVEVKDGSLKIWVQAATALYIAISAYGGFRSGIDYLVGDARIFSESVRSTLLDTGVVSSSIDVFQRRLGVVGRIKRILVSIDKVQSGYYYDISDRNAEYDRLKALLLEILVELDDERDRVLLISSLPEVLVGAVGTEKIPVQKFPRMHEVIAARPEDWDVTLQQVDAKTVSLRGLRAISSDSFKFDASIGRILPVKSRRLIVFPTKGGSNSS